MSMPRRLATYALIAALPLSGCSSLGSPGTSTATPPMTPTPYPGSANSTGPGTYGPAWSNPSPPTQGQARTPGKPVPRAPSPGREQDIARQREETDRLIARETLVGQGENAIFKARQALEAYYRAQDALDACTQFGDPSQCQAQQQAADAAREAYNRAQAEAPPGT